jgi:predicted GH43/DUF377 family glycosyl hydrolase
MRKKEGSQDEKIEKKKNSYFSVLKKLFSRAKKDEIVEQMQLEKNFALKKVIKKKKVVKKSLGGKKDEKKVVKKVVKKVKKPASKKVSKKSASKTESKKVTKAEKQITALDLKRSETNPILLPNPENSWESKATFNAAAVYLDNKVHLLYRAIGDDDVSVLGYASSEDGFCINERLLAPAYANKKENTSDGSIYPIPYSSGGGWNGGCEDPRLTLIDDTIYLVYTAFDGWGSLGIGFSFISVSDFLNKNWNWKKPLIISPPEQMHKNWVIFPEKINGKYAILHSVKPKILIDYFKNLKELDGEKFIKSNNLRPADKRRTWDSWFRGVGPTPIKTKYGWLIIYHAMDHKNPDRYRMGAMILDLKDPTKILYRSKKPILEPEECYENEGLKWGVIYCCGAVVMNDQLMVYYGGADMVVCVATANLNKFLKELISTGAPKLKPQIKEKPASTKSRARKK